MPQPVLVGEAIVAHDECREAVCEGVDAGTRLCVGALIRPYNVKARVDARNGEAVEGRVAERERSEVVSVWELHGSQWLLFPLSTEDEARQGLCLGLTLNLPGG